MAYNKTNWQDDVTPLSATNLNKMEQGIADAHAHLSETMPHIFVDSGDGKTYRYGLSAVNGVVNFNYEEVV